MFKTLQDRSREMDFKDNVVEWKNNTLLDYIKKCVYTCI